MESRERWKNAERGEVKVKMWSTDFLMNVIHFQSLKWREKWGVDEIESWESPSVFTDHIPYGNLGFDKEGSPIILIPFAGVDIWGLLHSAAKRDIIKNTIKLLEGEEINW